MSLSTPLRLTVCNDAPTQDGDYVLYWMIAARRAHWNLGLDHAIARARELGVGLVVLEPLRLGYRWSSPRLHRFVVEGMRDNQADFDRSPVRYLAYVEGAPGEGRGLLRALAARACCVVTDRYPAFFLPRMVEAAATQLPVRLEAVDGNGLLPLDAAGKAYSRAHDFRRHMQRVLRDHLDESPNPEPLAGLDLPRPTLPDLSRWRFRAQAELAEPDWIESLPLAHSVSPSSTLTGGSRSARRALDGFVAERLDRYADGRNHPDDAVASGLSPWLHFGHLSSHEVFWRVLSREGWSATRLGAKATGKRAGWWGASAAAQGYLDQLLTWRELGYGFCAYRPDYEAYESLPEWAQRTLADHADDPREHVYSLEEFDGAQTHDPIWNAAQRELRSTGVMHNYLRMLWGKKVLHWTARPQDAFEILIELNNRYALDGRDPNSISGIAWCFGRFDRAWGPERHVFGKIRYMTSDSTRRKLRLTKYLARWGPG